MTLTRYVSKPKSFHDLFFNVPEETSHNPLKGLDRFGMPRRKKKGKACHRR